MGGSGNPGAVFVRWREQTDSRCTWQIRLVHSDARKSPLSNECLMPV
jgi:hypothetical protein